MVVAAAMLLTVLAASGLVVEKGFDTPSTAKYLVTVGAPLLVALLALANDPLRALVALTIVIAPFNFIGTFADIEVSPTMLLLLGGVVLAVFDERVVPGAARPHLGGAAALALALLVGPVATSVDPFKYGMWVVQLAAAGWLAYHVARRPGGLEVILWAIVGAAVVQAAVAVWGFKTGQRLDLYDASGQAALGRDDFFNFGDENRAAGGMPDPISLGNVLALACPVALVLAHRARTLGLRLAVAGCGTLIVLGLMLTFSRMSWIAAVVGIAVAIMLLPLSRRVLSIVALAGLMFVTLSAGLAFGGNAITQRWDSIAHPTARQNSTSEGDKTRVRLWGAAWATARANPVDGVGFGNAPEALASRTRGVKAGTHAHSTYLQFAAEGGLMGALALAAVILAAGLDLLRGRFSDPLLTAGLTGAAVSVLVVWATDFTVQYVPVGAIMASLLGAIAGQSRVRLRDVVSAPTR
ncbi:MAG TPA: O-antigen ligase family protein [Baekduia sp.]|nr:O-antigen ligase family protein [Baekduia sp.]